MTKELALNVILAALAAGVGAAAAMLEATPVPTTKAAAYAALIGAAYGFVRGFVGYLKQRFSKPFQVDE